MRLWHKDLIKVLPNQMLVSQWRELSAIVGSINKNGTPNHRLVNILLEYPKSDLYFYTIKVKEEMIKRNIKTNKEVFDKITNYTGLFESNEKEIFKDWHNNKYFIQCFHNLEEKYDRGIITQQEWKKILNLYNIKKEGENYEK